MRIIFLTPYYSVSERYGSKTNLKKCGYLPPLGLALLGTILENDGHEVKVMDLQLYDLTLDEITEEVRKFSPGLIGMSCATPTANRAFRMAEHLKEKLNIPIVFGGPHVSFEAEKVLEKENFIDIIIIGEAELPMKELVRALADKTPLEEVKGIAFRKDGKVVKNPPSPVVEDLDELPIAQRKFFKMEDYIPLPNNYKQLPSTNMVTSRGCIYGKCTFCHESGPLGHKPRRNSVKRVIEEIKYLQKDYGYKEINFWDDEFVLGHANWVSEFCDELKKEDINITWTICSRASSISYGLAKKMKDAGCWNIFLGIESGNQQILNNIKKGVTLEQMRQGVKAIQDAGIEIRGSFVFALPGETPAIAEETINFAKELDLDYAQFCINTPYPGTPLFYDADKYGKLSLNFDEFNVFNPVYVPFGYKDAEEIRLVQKRAYRRFYYRPKYVWKHIKKIRSWEDVKKYLSGVKLILGIS